MRIFRSSLNHIVVLIILFIPSTVLAEYEYGFLQETLFGRLPGARAEAMGMAYVAIDGDMTCSYFNPAGTATINGLEVNGSHATPFYFASEATYNYLNAGYKFSRYLVAGFSMNQFSLGIDVPFINSDGDIVKSGTPKNTNYALNISSQPIKNLFIGVNANCLAWNPILFTKNAFYFDFGVIKKIEFNADKPVAHSINLAASIVNFNFASLPWEYDGFKSEYDLPVITRYGVSYHCIFDKYKIHDSLRTLQVLVETEYQSLLNSDYHSAIRGGAEITLLEILAIRFGYYKESEGDYGDPEYNKDEISSFTYGFGLHIPFSKLTGFPMNVSFDYTSLTQPSYTNLKSNWSNFSSINLRINFLFKKNLKKS